MRRSTRARKRRHAGLIKSSLQTRAILRCASRSYKGVTPSGRCGSTISIGPSASETGTRSSGRGSDHTTSLTANSGRQAKRIASGPGKGDKDNIRIRICTHPLFQSGLGSPASSGSDTSAVMIPRRRSALVGIPHGRNRSNHPRRRQNIEKLHQMQLIPHGLNRRGVVALQVLITSRIHRGRPSAFPSGSPLPTSPKAYRPDNRHRLNAI